MLSNNEEYIMTLDNNKRYVIINALEFEGIKYLYLINIDDENDYMITEFLEDSVKKVDDEQLQLKLVKEFLKISK